MTSPDPQQPSRPSWVWAVALLALVVAIPVAAVALRDEPRGVSGDHAATTVAAPTDESPGAAESPAAEPAQSSPAEEVAPVAPTSERGPVRALFFGDSYFIGGGYTGEDNSMARLASNRLGWESEVNGGGGTGFVQTNYDYDLGNYLDQIAAGAFDVGRRRWVVIEGGNNDVGQSLEDVRANARKVLRIAQRTFPNARVVLVGPLDTDSDHAELVPVIKVLRKAATKRSVPFVNMKNWLAGHYDLIGPDYVHPYPKGHRILGRKLARALRGLGA
ncbi:SGNH/GDSL hydrolase family protein [Nocardioides dilutus]